MLRMKKKEQSSLTTITSSLNLLSLAAQIIRRHQANNSDEAWSGAGTSGAETVPVGPIINLKHHLLLLVLTLGSHGKVCQIQIEMLVKSSTWFLWFFKVFENPLPSLPCNFIFLMNLMFQWNIYVFTWQMSPSSAGLCHFINMSKEWRRLKGFLLYNHTGICTGHEQKCLREENPSFITDRRSERMLTLFQQTASFQDSLRSSSVRTRVCSEAKRQLRVLTEASCTMHPNMKDQRLFFFVFFQCTKTLNGWGGDPLQWLTSRKVQASGPKCFNLNKWLNDQITMWW